MKRSAVAMVLLALFSIQAMGDALGDARITARIETMFLLNEHLSPFNINTSTSEAIVTLAGSVSDDVQRDLAGQLAASVDGVQTVQNNITVVEAYAPPAAPRTWRRRVEDLNIGASIRRRLLGQGELKGLKIGVDVQRGEVTLYGVVGTDEQSRRIAQVALETQGVARVRNNLTVRAKEPMDQVQNVGRQIGDEWVEKRVETSLLLNRHVHVRDLNIEVDDGVCVLTGLVNTSAQRELALSLAENIYGIGRVRNDIRVREESEPSASISDPPSESSEDRPAGETPEVPGAPEVRMELLDSKDSG